MSENQDSKAIVRRRMQATREELFDAWTDQEGMPAWMCPGDVVSADMRLDPRVGGKLHITMHSPTATYEHTGEFRVVERPSKLVFTWTAENFDGQITLVTIEFLEVSRTETELILTHERIPRKDLAERYQSGWGKIVATLEQRLEAQHA
ncbi:MAG TPA: SRPBCC domain-containing protein [Bryobacteraceae bacterium]|nr:SRPBCC domain-containing protein [Bryobacteraceae bacterium]